MARVYNWKREPVDERDIKSIRYLTKAAEKLPAKFQLEFDIPIYDQEDLGSCTANSGCSCYRYESAQILKNFGFDPSRLFLYYNTRLIENTVEYDSGAYIRDTFKAMNKYGLAPEADFPYITNTFTKKPTSAAYTNALKNIIVKYAKVDQDETVIKKTLQSGASVSFGFNVYQSFEAGNWQTTTGIMPIPKPGEKILGGHACFTKDTKISLLDGKDVTLEYLVKEYSDKSFYVYSYDIEKNQIVPGLAHSPRKTGDMQKILKMTLDNGEIIKCTENHPILMRNGEYKEAKDLEPGDSLMPLYRKINDRGYEMFLENKTWKLTHRYMVDWTKKSSNEHTVVHHIDFNKRNNSPDNLLLMTWNDHTELHARQSDLLQQYAKSDRGRERSREIMKRNWANPIWKEKTITQNKKNGIKSAEIQLQSGIWHFNTLTPEEKSRMSRENIKFALAQSQTQEAKQKRSDTIKRKMIEDTEFAKKRRECGINNWKKYNEQYRNGEIILTGEQLELRRLKNIDNLKKITPEQKKLAQLKTTYARFYKDKYNTFDEYISDKYPNNHKIISIEEFGYEDVYDITVEKYHNFALSSGVFVHNCTITGWDDSKNSFLIQNSWGIGWGLKGKFWMPYSFLFDWKECDDFWSIEEIRSNTADPTVQLELKDLLLTIFKSKKELNKNTEDVVVRIGILLNLPVDLKLTKANNVKIVATYLELK